MITSGRIIDVSFLLADFYFFLITKSMQILIKIWIA